MSRDDFDIPDLGPAEPERTASHNTQSAAPAGRTQASGGGGGWFQTFLLVLLVAGCSGMGYWVLTLTEQLKAEAATTAALKEQVAEVRQMLNLAESSAAKSGDTLQSQIAGIGQTAEEKYKHFDSEIAKLWTIAYQRNKPELEKLSKSQSDQDAALKASTDQLKQLSATLGEQDKVLKALSGSLAGQDKALKALEGSVEAHGKALKSVDALVAKAQKSMQEGLNGDLKKIRADLIAAQASVRLSEESISEERAALTQSMRAVTDRVASLESLQRKNDLERRIKTNEDAITAFDATRRELNRSLLQIKKRLNELQLAVETQAKR